MYRAMSAPLALGLVLILSSLASPVLAEEGEPEASTATAAKPMTLEACTAYALEHSPLITAATKTVQAAEYQYDEAAMAWVPVIKGSVVGAPLPEKTGTPLEGSTDYGAWGYFFTGEMNLAMPLYTFGKISTAKELAEKGIDIAKAKKSLTAIEVKYLVKRAYLTWLFARELVDIMQEGRKYFDQAKKYVEKLDDEDSDDLDPSDLQKIKVYEADIVQLEVESTKLLALAKTGLKAIMGLPHDAQITIIEGSIAKEDVTLLPLEILQDKAKALHPKAKIATSAIKAKGLFSKLEKLALLPDLFFGGFFKYAKSNAADPQSSPFAYDPYNTWTGGGGIGLKVTLDFGKRLSKANKYAAEQASLVNQKLALEEQIALEVQEVYLTIEGLETLIEVYETSEKAARGWLIGKTDLYINGFSSFEGLRDALVQFFKRRVARLQAVYDYDMAIIALQRAVGAPLDELVAPAE